MYQLLSEHKCTDVTEERYHKLISNIALYACHTFPNTARIRLPNSIDILTHCVTNFWHSTSLSYDIIRHKLLTQYVTKLWHKRHKVLTYCIIKYFWYTASYKLYHTVSQEYWLSTWYTSDTLPHKSSHSTSYKVIDRLCHQISECSGTTSQKLVSGWY